VTLPANSAEAAYRFLYERRRRKYPQPDAPPADLPCKIISVGNITVGGTGKTPAVQWIARMLQAHGVQVAVVARGYGGAMSKIGALVADGAHTLLDARQAGDEPVLHARSLPGVPVIIGRDREAGVRRAVELGAEVVVLDDGFQYWSLYRDFDLVLLDARLPFGNGRLLPVGRLREPPETLQRANAILLTRVGDASPSQLQSTKEAVAARTAAPIFESNHAPVGLRDERSGEPIDLERLQQLPVLALSAIADNDSFVQSLAHHGAHVVHAEVRRDHHRWTASELQRAVAQALQHGAEAIVTTEKDAVKIDSAWCGTLPLWSLRIQLQVLGDASALEASICRAIGLVAAGE